MKVKKGLLRGIVVAAASAALIVPSAAFAQGGPPPGHGGGGGETTLGNNLSVPAIFVGDTGTAPALRVPCDETPQDPTGTQSTQFPGYWLQKTDATWSATCDTADAATVTAQWGANLTDAPNLAAGKPIRVEVSLLDLSATGRQGYVVTNLTPELADRLATYGTDGTTFQSGVDGGASTRVWGPNTTLAITDLGTGIETTYPITAEINSTGAVVYGFNWGSKGRKNTPSPGKYRLTFTINQAVTIDGVVEGTNNNPVVGSDGHSTSIDITLSAANRGGGGGGRH